MESSSPAKTFNNFFNFLITSCVIVIKGDPDQPTNLHRDLGLALETIEKAAYSMSIETIRKLLVDCSTLSPHSLLISFYTSTLGIESVRIYFNGSHLIYDSILAPLHWFTKEGDIRCQVCAVRLTRGPGLRDLTKDLDTSRSRIVVHVKPSYPESPGSKPFPTTVTANLATALQMLENFLYSGFGMVMPQKPVRQVTFTLWKSQHGSIKDWQFGKLSLLDSFIEKNTGGPLYYQDWMDKQQNLQCWNCPYDVSLLPSRQDLDLLL